MKETLRVGTRASALALAQADEVISRLRGADPRVRTEVVVIRTHGDEGYRSDLGTELDGKRAFTKRIEEALFEDRIDVAVHSLKDLPTDSADGLVLAAIPPRGDPRDVLVANNGKSFDALPAGTKVGTSSLRRRAQVLARWPGLVIVELHGNLDTRIRRLAAGELDAVIVAAAGLQRLGIRGPHAEPIDPDLVTPAPGQGALAVQAREDDERARDLLATINDAAARTATTAERALSMRIGGGCNVPLGALATLEGGVMTLRAAVASPDGRRLARVTERGPSAGWQDVVDEALRRLHDRGAREILEEAA